MEKVLNSNSLEEGTVKRSIILLYQKMIKKLPEYFSEQEINVIQHSSFSEIVVQLNEQNMLENFHNKYGRKNYIFIFFMQLERRMVKCIRLLPTLTPVEMKCWSSISLPHSMVSLIR